MLVALISFAHKGGVRPQLARAAHTGGNLLGDVASQAPEDDDQSSLNSSINQVGWWPCTAVSDLSVHALCFAARGQAESAGLLRSWYAHGAARGPAAPTLPVHPMHDPEIEP